MLKVVSCGSRTLRTNTRFIKSVNLQLRTFSCTCYLNHSRNIRSTPCDIVKYRNNVNLSVFGLSRVKNCYSSTAETGTLSKNEFENRCNETLESLCEYFEEIIESCAHLKGCDVMYSDGVLNVHFGNEHGTYVINRQTPNQQIWLSSPTSGPKRYDFVVNRNTWIYRHDDRSLHELLQEEIPKIVKSDVNFFRCANAG